VNPVLRRLNLSFDHRSVSRTLKLVLTMAAIWAAWSAPAAACTVSSTALQIRRLRHLELGGQRLDVRHLVRLLRAQTPIISISQATR
jgi:hypothetical protein